MNAVLHSESQLNQTILPLKIELQGRWRRRGQQNMYYIIGSEQHVGKYELPACHVLNRMVAYQSGASRSRAEQLLALRNLSKSFGNRRF